jgi:hypothetical protein
VIVSTWIAVAVLSGPSVQESGAQTPAAREGEWGQAPDGEKGFGPRRTVRDVTKLLRSTSDEDRGIVDGLRRLEVDIRVLLSLATERYQAAGYFDLIAIAEKEKRAGTGEEEIQATPLERLGAIFRERAFHAGVELPKGGRAADLLARLLVDTRFRARAQVIDGLEFEAADLKAGLAVLSAELDGFVGLHDDEAEAIARRVDLAASRLRAAKLDLEALREDSKAATAGESWGKDLEALYEIIRTDDVERRARELPEILDRLEQREAGMASALFTTRLETKLENVLEDRRQALAAANGLLKGIRAYFPGTPESEKAGPEITRLSKSRRYGEAGKMAAHGLRYDPLNEELNWFEGETSDLLSGSMESRRFFDRYLALRGIRIHDHRTFKDRKLTREERRAFDAVQAVGTTPQGTPTQTPGVQPPK